jgi:hypothetical protein
MKLGSRQDGPPSAVLGTQIQCDKLRTTRLKREQLRLANMVIIWLWELFGTIVTLHETRRLRKVRPRMLHLIGRLSTPNCP